ncbi:dihydroorotate dehydrogenase electron transfer subunit [Halobacillus sp. SY10]|uniref:Dihydroorotate dehydrogenase B (NAD(+)), electron transfer subunit n=2 Tax=Halobacillus TaxID=45667 RepID=A0A1H0UT05_HALAD|nr:MULTISPECIES: dihydroorotate dehydrogenase electron transfer subunit [Halobacillus]RDY69196.1 dihydroorotate dehydrogenase electron transfer subunit [Halobacillus trueperi]SDP69028.1 dihydroorotate dehydrogenase electron transfer subunit [Halobacillus aidingensis]
MKNECMTILKHEKVARDTHLLVLEGNLVHDIMDPGQFVHIRIDGFYLRRPVSIADYDPAKETMTLIYKVMGDGTKALTNRRVGEQLDVLGPGGQGFPTSQIHADHALIIGGGIGVPPLYSTAKKLKENGVAVTSILGFRSREDAFLLDEFRALGEVHVTTEDGSLGRSGRVTDALPCVKKDYQHYLSCGPTVMLKAVADHLPDKEGYLSMEERMGCGIGACFACVVESKDEKGYKRICCDGPVFKAEEVVLS